MEYVRLLPVFGLKKVRNRRDDALSRTSWQDFESLLADHYRRDGYEVEHVGTGRSGSRFDGGIDLKLRRNGEYVVVQCKHWNARQVPHNEVHQLIGVVLTEEAQRGVLVTSGEFTVTARQKAQKSGLVELIDGGDLRRILGPVTDAWKPREADDSFAWNRAGKDAESGPSWTSSGAGVDWTSVLGRAAEAAAGAYSGNGWTRSRRRGRGGLLAALGVQSLLGTLVLNLLIPLVIAVAGWFFIKGVLTNMANGMTKSTTVTAASALQVERPRAQVNAVPSKRPQPAEVQQRQGIYRLTDEELKEWERKNAEAMKVLEDAGVPELAQ